MTPAAATTRTDGVAALAHCLLLGTLMNGTTMRGLALGMAAAAMFGCGGGSGSAPPPADAGVQFQADPPSVYVAKVKNILTGTAPTDDEVAQVVANPGALPSLVTSWMATPQYTAKMQVFFELAFQQGQITEVDLANQIPPNGLEVGAGVDALVQNMSESMARTAIAMIAANQPITNAFTTKQFMMTPALMQLYAFLDEYQVADADTVTDAFAQANRKVPIVMEASAGPVALADTLNPQSPNYMHWYNGALAKLPYPAAVCQGEDPIKFEPTGLALEQMLFGMVPTHFGTDGKTLCITRPGGPDGTQFTAADFTTWKLVTIRPPTAGEATTQFDDLDAIRSASELVLNTPHLGFFSTPAFFANWPTNTSNQMRVILNQALIVATGTAIDGTDPTTPATTPGLDAVHAMPGSACFGCHQLLDPSRSILSATYSWYGSIQTDPTLISQPGLFAFQGVIQPVTTIDSFATILATHPLVAQAWAEKLCYYASSAACDPSDPVFQQIVADFKAANFNWTTLVSELMASPLVTNAIETKTWDTNGEVIAVSRRDHLCAQLNNRLGLVDICGLDATISNPNTPSTIAQIVSGLPSDGYGRGAAIPVLPLSPTLFYRAGLENICEAVAPFVIDGPQPAQPGAKQWSSSDPTTAIADFVSLIMGLPSSDPRSAGAVTALTSHFAAATAAGASANAALASTFTVACLSPSFIGMGM